MPAHQLNGATGIETGSPLPLYYQLKQVLLHQIQNGDFRPGEVFPSEKELEERYAVSRITVRRALGDLASEGYISRQAGRGTFVLPGKLLDRSEKLGGLIEDLLDQGYEVQSEILEHRLVPVPQDIGARLAIPEGNSVLYFEKLVYADGAPIALAMCYFNLGPHVQLTVDELNQSTIYPLLERKYGIVIRHAERTIEATAALRREAKVLGVKVNAPMLLARLHVIDERGQPVAYVKTLYRGDRYKHSCPVHR